MDEEPAISLAGFHLWVHDYQFPHLTDYHDGNWLRVTVECIGHGATVRLADSCVCTYELEQWTVECEALSAGQQRTATLPTMENYLQADIGPLDPPSLARAKAGAANRLTVRLTPDGVTSHHKFRYDMDPSDLARLIVQLRVLLARFPVRGRHR